LEVQCSNDATLSELRAHLADRAQAVVSIPTRGRVMQGAGLGAQKKCVVAAERNNYKRAWFWRRARALRNDRVIFADEAASTLR